MEQAGVHDCLLGRCNLEYPAFMQWIDKHRPVGLEIINTGQDLRWLASHPEMLFPNDSSLAAKWFSIIQHRTQDAYVKNHKTDILCLGRRIQDGNYVGPGGMYTNTKGITRFLLLPIPGMRKFLRSSIIIIFQCLRFILGRVAFVLVHIVGLHANGVVA